MSLHPKHGNLKYAAKFYKAVINAHNSINLVRKMSGLPEMILPSSIDNDKLNEIEHKIISIATDKMEWISARDFYRNFSSKYTNVGHFTCYRR